MAVLHHLLRKQFCKLRLDQLRQPLFGCLPDHTVIIDRSRLDHFGFENSTKRLPGSSEFTGYITMSNERLLAMNPDKVLVVNPSGDSAKAVQSLIPFFPRLKTSDFVVMEYYGLINPGSLSSIQSACIALSNL